MTASVLDDLKNLRAQHRSAVIRLRRRAEARREMLVRLVTDSQPLAAEPRADAKGHAPGSIKGQVVADRYFNTGR